MNKRYAVKEIFYTLQGEGQHAGRPAVFCRFSGCNLWSGREEDRSTAICQFCDTNFWGTDGQNGGKYSAERLVDKCVELWSGTTNKERYVVCTGGEPALQIDDDLVKAFHEKGFEIAIETNGTLVLPSGIDWVCMSPKANTDIALSKVDEIKLVYPQEGILPEDFKDFDTEYFFLQPMEEGKKTAENTNACIQYCLDHPQWRLSLQTHKIVGID